MHPKDTSSVQRIVLLTGKLYYELAKERNSRGLDEKVALIRIEELSPFPFSALQETLARYPHVEDICWVQEEPRNQGAWTHVAPRISNVLSRVHGSKSTENVTSAGNSTGVSNIVISPAPALRYIGRKEDAVPAVGVGKIYKQQQSAVVQLAFEGL